MGGQDLGATGGGYFLTYCWLTCLTETLAPFHVAVIHVK